jgi:choline dehydrogenase-like flavoprotein
MHNVIANARKTSGVVDDNLKVYGTHNLRVVDASIIPLEIAAHTQATVYGIAEKVSDVATCVRYAPVLTVSERRQLTS